MKKMILILFILKERLSFDYYGSYKYYFYPYKATEGELKIQYSLD